VTPPEKVAVNADGILNTISPDPPPPPLRPTLW
jgi:hypothetical protein